MRRLSLLCLLFGLAFSACGSGPEPPPAADPTSARRLVQGEIVGFASPDHAAQVERAEGRRDGQAPTQQQH